MKFPLDPGDVLGHGCWETLKRVLAMASTLWVGFIVALMSLYSAELLGILLGGGGRSAGAIVAELGESILWSLLVGPFVVVLSLWGLIVVPLMVIALYLVFREEKEVTWVWYFMVLAIGLVSMRNLIGMNVSGLLEWVVFVLVMVSLGVACWFYRGWQRGEHARHLQEIHAGNELRRLEMAQRFGTESFGQEHVDEGAMGEDSGGD